MEFLDKEGVDLKRKEKHEEIYRFLMDDNYDLFTLKCDQLRRVVADEDEGGKDLGESGFEEKVKEVEQYYKQFVEYLVKLRKVQKGSVTNGSLLSKRAKR